MVNFRLRRLVAQVCAAEDPTPEQVPSDKNYSIGRYPGFRGTPAEYTFKELPPGTHVKSPDGWDEGSEPLAPEEESGLFLPDGHKRRKLPDVEYGSLDLQATRKKYADERQKRVDATKQYGNTGPEPASGRMLLQYQHLVDLAKSDPRFAKMIDDPYVTTPPRAPRTDEVTVAILGAGYGGLTQGARLREQGIEAKEICMFDKGGDVGGTWYWNRYPGAMCDIEAYVYMPLCDELGYTPAEKYCHQNDMMVHSQMIAERYGLYENCALGTQITELRWNDQTMRWVIGTDRGDAIRAKFAVVNFGFLTHPKLPAVPGLPDFEGHMFHTSRWDYQYTGGSNAGGLTKLRDKKVGLVGTGATAIQAISHVGRWAQHLYVFQRTPSTMDVRNNHFTTKEYREQYLTKPGWQNARMANFGAFLDGTASDELEDLVNDGFTSVTHRVQDIRRRRRALGEKVTAEESRDITDRSDYEHVERIRLRISAVVKDQKTAEALKPWFRIGCKRPCFHDDYLPTFNRPNVTLVDTNGHGIQGMTKKGIISEGVEYEIDCAIFATGFETAFVTPQSDSDSQGVMRKVRNNGFEIYGRNGLNLADYWSTGPRTLRGFATHKFPNIFWLNGPQGSISSSGTYTLDEFGKHIAHVIAKLGREGKTIAEVNQQAEEDYCKMIYDSSLNGRKFFAACTPGYYSNEGDVDTTTKSLAALYPEGRGNPRFFDMLKKQQADDNTHEGFDIS